MALLSMKYDAYCIEFLMNLELPSGNATAKGIKAAFVFSPIYEINMNMIFLT